jgi:hypothetical protein
MVDALTGSGIKRVASCDRDTFIINQGIENRFLEGRGPHIRSKGGTVDGDIDTPMRFIRYNLDALGGCKRTRRKCEDCRKRDQATHKLCPLR